MPALCAVLDDPDPVVRGHAALALGEIGAGRDRLQARLESETDARVQAELRTALDALPHRG